jgi:hypothetical protein
LFAVWPLSDHRVTIVPQMSELRRTLTHESSPLGVSADGIAKLLNHAGFGLAERRRSRTYQPLGYNGLPVLKTGWATGPVPLQEGTS